MGINTIPADRPHSREILAAGGFRANNVLRAGL